MAEKVDEIEAEMSVADPKIIKPEDLGGDDDDEDDHLVDLIIQSYKKKVQEVKGLNNTIDGLNNTIDGLNNTIDVMKKITKEDRKKIKQLLTTNSKLCEQLRSSTCKQCGATTIREQFSSLSIQGTMTKEKESEVDGGQPGEHFQIQPNKILRKRPDENQESDEDETHSDPEYSHNFKCPYAACGLDALLYLFYKVQLNFCPTRFVQKVGKVTGYKGISCTQILNNLKDKEGRFLKRIYDKNIIEGKHKEVLDEAKSKFKESGQDAGILSYSTATYKHCVNLYKNKDGKIKTYDANRGKKYIKDWNQASYVEICVLESEIEDGVVIPHIRKRWSECHIRHCKKEKEKLSTLEDRVFENNPIDCITLDTGHQ